MSGTDRLSFRAGRLLILYAALFFTPASWGQDRLPLEIIIIGADHLLPLLQDNLQIIRLTREQQPSGEELQRLLNITPQQVRDLLATEAYFSPQIEILPQQAAQPNTVRIRVSAGAPTLVSAVTLHFTGAIEQDPDVAQRVSTLRQRWPLKPGQAFRQAAWDTAKNTVLGALLLRDYPAASIVASAAHINPATQSAQLQVTIDSGARFRFGTLDIHGLQRYPRQLIERINTIRPGDPYSQDRLSELQARVLDTGYFRSAFATIDVATPQPERTPIQLELTEIESKQLGVGLGVSTDSGARGQLKWLDRRFLNRDWRLEAILRADRQSQLLSGDLYLQAFEAGFAGMLQSWIPSFGSSIERTELTGEEIEKIRNIVRLSAPSRTDERVLSASFLADRRTIGGLPSLTRQALIASYSLTRRRLDQPLSPRSGYVAGITLSAGIGGVLNEDNIARALLHGVWLRPLSKRWTSVLRLQTGQLAGAHEDSVPEDLLFRTGGDRTVRGYAFGSLGVPRNNAIVGGNVMALVSAELVYQLTPQWGLALFTDAGDAAASWQSFRLKRGSGIGARWRSPIGPINFDLAHGHETNQTRLHFSVGYGF
jgi:translocation and assembly module TamA